jgi:hypothetical protein
MSNEEANKKATQLNSKFPNLKCEVVEVFGGALSIKVCDSDKAKTLNEMFSKFDFSF